MTERQKTITTVLFWGAFGVFLGVSIPHIAWIVRQYMPQQNVGWLADDFYWLLALAYAVAIDGIMAWLTHAQSSHQGGGNWKSIAFTWAFIVALVAMSWYLNWLYNALHDPSKTFTDVWNFVLMDKLWAIPQMTVANFTPVLLGALPVFTIAYVGVLNNVQHMRAQAEKSLAELQQEADEKEERAQLMQRIKDAEKSKKQGADQTIAQAFGLVKKVKTEAQGVIGERKEKKDPQALMLAKVVDFYRATPHLLTDEKHADSTELMIKNMLKLRKITEAKAWRIQAAEMLKLEQAKTPTAEVKTEEVDHEVQPAKTEETPVFDAGENDEPAEAKPVDLPDEKTASLGGQNDTAPAPSSAGKTDGKTEQEEAEQQTSQPDKNGTQERQEEARSDLSQDTLFVIERYPAVYTSWIARQVKSVTIDEIVEVTKQPKRRVQYQVGRALKTTPRSPEKILVSSIITWLKTAPIPEQMSGLGEATSTGKDTEPLAKVDPLKEQEKEENNASQNGNHNGHKNGHHESESPLNLPEYEPVG